VLWRLGECNVRTVQETLAVARPLAYTTVMTMLERLARKQLVSRRKSGRNFVYAPQIDRETVRRSAVQQLLDALFESSPEHLRAFLAAAGIAEPANAAMPVTASPAVLPAQSVAPVEAESADEMGDSDLDAVLL